MSVKNRLELYHKQIEKASDDMAILISELANLLYKIPPYATIYITGIGKSYHIAKKSIATWQCLNIRTQSLLIQDLTHGDFGILKENDVIIYVSNSGNTTELLDISKYVKDNFNVTQISITNNENCKLNQYMDYAYNICKFKIQEVDNFNIIPTASSVLFLIFLDLLGLQISEINNYQINEFKKNHPNGLGKII